MWKAILIEEPALNLRRSLIIVSRKMRRMNNLVTLFTTMFAFFFGSFLTSMLSSIDKCPTQKSGIAKLEQHPEIFLVILILSAPGNHQRRQAMRETWLTLAKPLLQPYFPETNVYLPHYDEQGFPQPQLIAEQADNAKMFVQWKAEFERGDKAAETIRRNMKVKHFFAIGTHNMDATLKRDINAEHAQHKDLLLLPRLQDSYANLTEKLLHSIDALKNHYDFSYMLKVDDDTYVKLDYLLNELISYDRKILRNVAKFNHQPLPELYWGYFNGRATIKTKGQWREPHYVLAQHYIVYALGGGYVISRHLVEFIEAHSHHLSTYVSEDVSMGTWLAPLRHVYRRHDIRFDTGYMPRSCRSYHLVLHKRNESQFRDLFAGNLCTFEGRAANEQKSIMRRPVEYLYDWHKPADKCCDTIANI